MEKTKKGKCFEKSSQFDLQKKVNAGTSSSSSSTSSSSSLPSSTSPSHSSAFSSTSSSSSSSLNCILSQSLLAKQSQNNSTDQIKTSDHYATQLGLLTSGMYEKRQKLNHVQNQSSSISLNQHTSRLSYENAILTANTSNTSNNRESDSPPISRSSSRCSHTCSSSSLSPNPSNLNTSL